MAVEVGVPRGDSTGSLYYADYLLDGRAGTQDVDQALELYQNLVDTKAHDEVSAALKLGDIYSQGTYVTRVVQKAKQYYQIALDDSKEGSDTAAQAQEALDALGA